MTRSICSFVSSLIASLIPVLLLPRGAPAPGGRCGAPNASAGLRWHCVARSSAFGSSRHSRTCPVFTVRTIPTSSRISTCLSTARSDIGSGWASSLTEAGPAVSRVTMSRRVGSPRAANVRASVVVVMRAPSNTEPLSSVSRGGDDPSSAAGGCVPVSPLSSSARLRSSSARSAAFVGEADRAVVRAAARRRRGRAARGARRGSSGRGGSASRSRSSTAASAAAGPSTSATATARLQRDDRVRRDREQLVVERERPGPSRCRRGRARRCAPR